MPNPHLKGWIAASVPKAGSRAEENEDAAVGDANRVRFAIADGASEGWQSRGWAKFLARAFVERPPGPADFDRWLAVVRSKWTPPAPKAEAWYAEVKSEQGSFATLLGLEFRLATDPPGLVWKCAAVGDSCLFLVRGAKFDVTFPLAAADAFGNQPPLVPSSAERECPEAEWLAGWSEPGDLFLLATDAVAKLLLEANDAAHPLIQAAEQGIAEGSAAPIAEKLSRLRSRLKDDATLLAVKVAQRRSN
jgi:hypothetical protein